MRHELSNDTTKPERPIQKAAKKMTSAGKRNGKSVGRRTFVKASAAAGVVALTTSARSYGRIIGSNDELRVAVIGFKGRGKALLGAIKRAEGAKLVGLCDVDEHILRDYDADNKQLFRTTDLREVLQRDDVDAIASATPNHWHALLTCWASEAGKHVYIEKPISHNMYESKMIVDVVRKNKTIVQCGFQNRSDSGLLTFFDNLLSGKYGQVLSVHGTCHRQRASIGKLDSPLTIPAHINYDLWAGPAAKQDVMRPKLHYDWHWDFNTGNGDVGNQGPHEWDMMNWALGNPDQLPTEMVAAGNRFGWNDAGNTPNVMACAGVTNGIPFCFEVMDLKGGRKAPDGRGVGVIIQTDKGRFVGGRGEGQYVSNDGKQEVFQRDEATKRQDGLQSHMANFVKAVHDNDHTILRSEAAVAANSSAMAHMANISFQLAESAQAEQLEAAFGQDVQQRDMLARLRESVMLFGMANEGVNRNEPWLLGPRLQFDNSNRQFTGAAAAEANQKMTRDYRSGFELV